jgi:hypothetical protein
VVVLFNVLRCLCVLLPLCGKSVNRLTVIADHVLSPGSHNPDSHESSVWPLTLPSGSSPVVILLITTLGQQKLCSPSLSYFLYLIFFFVWLDSLIWAWASSFRRGFMVTHLRHTTVGRTPLDEGPARRRDLYLTTHNTHKRQTSMPPVGFEPTILVSERPKTHALDQKYDLSIINSQRLANICTTIL